MKSFSFFLIKKCAKQFYPGMHDVLQTLLFKMYRYLKVKIRIILFSSEIEDFKSSKKQRFEKGFSFYDTNSTHRFEDSSYNSRLTGWHGSPMSSDFFFGRDRFIFTKRSVEAEFWDKNV